MHIWADETHRPHDDGVDSSDVVVRSVTDVDRVVESCRLGNVGGNGLGVARLSGIVDAYLVRVERKRTRRRSGAGGGEGVGSRRQDGGDGDELHGRGESKLGGVGVGCACLRVSYGTYV